MSFPGYQIKGCIKYSQGEEELVWRGYFFVLPRFSELHALSLFDTIKAACSFPFFGGYFWPWLSPSSQRNFQLK